MTIAPAQPDAAALPLVCHVQGLKQVALGMTPEGVCAQFRAPVEKQLGKQVRLAAAAPAGSRDWIRIDIRFSRPDTASATLSQMRAGKLTSYPEQSISVSDRRIDQHFVDQLARNVAAQIKLP